MMFLRHSSLFIESEKYSSGSLLRLLRSQLYLWGATFFGEVCVCVTGFFFVCLFFVFYPTIEAVTFHLHGWCMLGVFLLLAFTRQGHECQHLLSVLKCMCAQTRPQFILSSKRDLGNQSEPIQGKSPLYQRLKS